MRVSTALAENPSAGQSYNAFANELGWQQLHAFISLARGRDGMARPASDLAAVLEQRLSEREGL